MIRAGGSIHARSRLLQRRPLTASGAIEGHKDNKVPTLQPTTLNNLSAHPAQKRLIPFVGAAVLITLLVLIGESWNVYHHFLSASDQTTRILRMQTLRGRILQFDEVLTMSARMAGATGDPKWEVRYRGFEPQLDGAIKEALGVAPSFAFNQAAARTDAANIALVAMENRAFSLVRQGQLATAQALLSGTAYEAHKKVYAAGMAEFDSLLAGSIAATQRQQRQALRWDVVTVALATFGLGIGWWCVLLIARRWQMGLEHGNEQLKRQGALLEEANLDLDQKVAQRTADLTAKIAESVRAQSKIASLHQLYSVLSGINTTIARVNNAPDLFDSVCQVVIERGGFSMAWYGWLDPADGTLTPFAQRGLEAEDITAIKPAVGYAAEGPGDIAVAIRENRIAYTNDYQAESTSSAWHAKAVQRGVQSSAALPIHRDGSCVGILKLYVAERDYFDAERLALLDEVGKDISFALNNIARDERRVEAEGHLADSEARFRALTEHAADVVCVVDARGQFVYASPSFQSLTGYAPDEMLGRSFVEFTHPEDLRINQSALFEVLRNPGGLTKVELRTRHKNGSFLSIELIAKNALNDPSVGGIVVNARDITERKRQQQEVGFKNIVLSTQQEQSPDAILVVDETARIASYNRKFIALFSIPEDLVRASEDEPVLKHVVGQMRDPDAFLSKVRYVYEHKDESSHDEIETKDGRIIDRFSSSLMGANGEYYGRVWYFRDITERKQIEETRLAALRRVLAQRDAVSAVSRSEALIAGDVVQFAREITELAAKTAGVERANIWLFNDDETELRCIDLYEATPARHSGGGVLNRSQFANEFAVLENSSYVDADDPLTDPRTAGYVEGYLKPLRISSMLDAVVRISGKQLGLLCLEHVEKPHRWEHDEITFAAQLADKLGLVLANSDRQAAADKMHRSLKDTVEAIARTVETRDPFTAGHHKRTAELAAAIAGELGLPAERIEGIRLGATIFDIGKISIPAEILNRPGQLRKHELQLVKTHSQVGYDIVKNIDFPWPVAAMILNHHERLDGSGYPEGLKGEAIPLEARILAVADVVEAMCSHRPYRPALGVDAALEEIAANKGTLYDAAAVEACVRLFRVKDFAFGRSNGEAGHATN